MLRDAGIAGTDIGAILAHPALGRVCTALADRARDHFAIADRIMTRHPLRIVRAPVLMARVYQAILERVLARGFEPPRARVRTRRRTLLWTAVRFGLVRRS
jgi:phytoene synthase